MFSVPFHDGDTMSDSVGIAGGDEHDSLLDVYMRAMESTGPAPVAEAA